jgi:hypothetical protein
MLDEEVNYRLLGQAKLTFVSDLLVRSPAVNSQTNAH